jgi:hypothetical protein
MFDGCAVRADYAAGYGCLILFSVRFAIMKVMRTPALQHTIFTQYQFGLYIFIVYCLALDIWIYCNCASVNNGDMLQKCSIVIIGQRRINEDKK